MINQQVGARPTWTQFDVYVGGGGLQTSYVDEQILKVLQTQPIMKGWFWPDPSGMWVLRKCPKAGVRVWTSDDDFELTVRMRETHKITGATISSVAKMLRQHARTLPVPASIQFQNQEV